MKGNEISDEGVKGIAGGLEQNDSIETLILAKNDINDSGGELLAKCLETN
jgi:hypothetical protein